MKLANTTNVLAIWLRQRWRGCVRDGTAGAFNLEEALKGLRDRVPGDGEPCKLEAWARRQEGEEGDP